MAINTTASNFKGFTFDTFNSKNYGVYLTGAGVYNAPLRAVEMIAIPGRNGSFALDQGRFENIEVTYHASMVADNEADFTNAISDFRNAICSKVGYCRLIDEYNPNEYRMAVYKSGLDVTPKMLRTGEFDIVFECKPQRFLTSGETAVAVANNGTITNPTLFDSSPLLEFKGYGAIVVDDYEIEIENVPIGYISIADIPKYVYNESYTIALNTNNVNNNDLATANITFINYTAVDIPGDTGIGTVPGSPQPTDSSVNFSSNFSGGQIKTNGVFNFNIGTNATITNTVSGSANYYSNNKGDFIVSYSITMTMQYVASNNTLIINCSGTASTTTAGVTPKIQFHYLDSSTVTAFSTVSTITVYIDCDIGEAYTISNNEIVQLNNVTKLGAELPKLKSGLNTITYDNTITSLKITPRWWKV